MGLTSCQECGHRVSDRAPRCPGCGVEDPAGTGVRPRKSRTARRVVVVAIVGIFGFFLYLFVVVIAPLVERMRTPP